jgi:hypothetical protein
VGVNELLSMATLSVRETASLLGLRLGSCYSLLWDGVITGQKGESGEWRVDRESVERYRLRRTLRRATPRDSLQRSAIDVSATTDVHVVGA